MKLRVAGTRWAARCSVLSRANMPAYWPSLRPCLAPPITHRRRGLIVLEALSTRFRHGRRGYAQPMSTALLFERDRVDEVEDWPSCVGRLGRRSILWIDLDSTDSGKIAELVEELELTSETKERLENTNGKPYFGDFGSYLHVTAVAPSSDDDSPDLVKVVCLVSKSWVVTVHDSPLVVLDEFRERAEGSGEVGKLEGPEFLADLLEWVLSGYLGGVRGHRARARGVRHARDEGRVRGPRGRARMPRRAQKEDRRPPSGARLPSARCSSR